MSKKLDPSHNSLWRLWLTVHTRLIEQIERDLKQAVLPPLEWYDVLWALQETPEQQLRLHELAEVVLLSRSNLTRLVDRLEKAGLLRRESCPTDRRGAYAVLTPEGMAMQQKMWSVYSESIAEYFGKHLSDSEVQILTQVCLRLTEAAKLAEVGE